VAVDSDATIERAFARALNRVVQAKAEAVFVKTFQDNTPIGSMMTEKIESGLRRCLAETVKLANC
jgi:hypothetical protein